MNKHKRNSSVGGGSLKDETSAGIPLPRIRRKQSEGDALNTSNESNQWAPYDELDALPDSLRFNAFDILCILFSIFTYTLDLGMDCYIAYVYYSSKYIGYFVLTLIFIIIPAGTMTAFSLRWYVIDMDLQTDSKPSCFRWIIRTIFLVLQLAPVVRYVDSLIYGLKSRRAAKNNDKHSQIKYYTYMVNEDADATLLRLFEGFMESAPQVTLQTFILITHLDDPLSPFSGRSSYVQSVTILSSLVSLAWALSSYHRSLRYSQPHKNNISYKGTIFQFFWHFCTISSRIFALAVFSSTYPILTLPFCLAHWFFVLIWLIVQGKHHDTCSNNCEEALFFLVVAFIYVFTFFNIRDEPTRYKYLTYYVLLFIENSILLTAWFLAPIGGETMAMEVFWIKVSGIIGDMALFFLGIISMILYYSYFHPSLNSICQDGDKEGDGESLRETTKIRADFLSRRGSLDQGSHASSLSSSHHNSRRNVTFALDNNRDRSSSVGDTSGGSSGTNVLKLNEAARTLLGTSQQNEGVGGRRISVINKNVVDPERRNSPSPLQRRRIM